jgi:hypothetical protein
VQQQHAGPLAAFEARLEQVQREAVHALDRARADGGVERRVAVGAGLGRAECKA